MIRFILASLLAACAAAPAFAANEKQVDNPAKGKGWHCPKFAYEKYHIQDGRALNNAVEAAIQRCRQNGPSAL
jgi:Spy/CpxP family protein refolding chaperone